MKFFITLRIITRKVWRSWPAINGKSLASYGKSPPKCGRFYCNYCMHGQNDATYLYQRGGQPNSNGMMPLKQQMQFFQKKPRSISVSRA
jgi:hypothetical protein